MLPDMSQNLFSEWHCADAIVERNICWRIQYHWRALRKVPFQADIEKANRLGGGYTIPCGNLNKE